MSEQGNYFTQQLVHAVRSDLAEASKQIADIAHARTLCFLEPDDHYVDVLLEAGFGNVVGYAPTPEAAGTTPEYFLKDSRVTCHIAPPDAFFTAEQEPFDFMFFTNPVHPEWVANLEEQALSVLKPGGYIYFLEPEKPAGFGEQLVRFDKILDQTVRRVQSLIGKQAQDSGGFRTGLERSLEGVDEMQLLRRLKRNGCRPVFIRYGRFAQTALFGLLGNAINYPQFFRILAVKD